MDEVESIQEKIGKGSKEMEILRKNQKEILEIKNIVTEMKSAFDGHNITSLKKDSLNLRISQQNPQKLKSKDNKDGGGAEPNIQKL